MPETRTLYWFFAALGLLAAIYGFGANGPWLFDDEGNLLANEALQQVGPQFDQWRTAALSSGSGPTRRPVAMLSFAANWALADGHPRVAAKAVNIALHLLATGLLFAFFRSLLLYLGGARDVVARSRATQLAAFAALLWAAQPLHVSTVLYVVQRMAILSTLFVFLGLWYFTRCRSRWARGGASVGELLASAAWLALISLLATFSKENGALLPWLLLCVELCVFRGQWRGRSCQPALWSAAVLLLAPLVLVIIVLLLDPDGLAAGYASRPFTLEERLLTQLRLLWRYLGWLLIPGVGGLGLFHDDIPPSVGWLSPGTTLLALLGWFALLAGALALRNRTPLLLLALLFYLVGHSMESSVLPLELVFEHRNYLPSALLYLVLAWRLATFARRLPGLEWRLPACGLLLILLSLLLLRTLAWRDGLELARTSAAQHPESSRSLAFYASEQLQQAQSEVPRSGAERAALRLRARHFYELAYREEPAALGSLVMMYQLDRQYFTRLDTPERWRREILAAIASRPLNATDRNALGTLLRCLGNGQCPDADGSFASELLLILRQRYSGGSRVALLEFEYLRAAGYGPGDRAAVLQPALDANPGSRALYMRLMEARAELGEFGAVYELAAGLMRRDGLRLNLLSLKNVFHPGEGPGLPEPVSPPGGGPTVSDHE